MEKVEIKTIETKQVIHRFYCDECRKLIKESVECEDGWCNEPKYFELVIINPGCGKILEMRKCLCNECEKELFDDIMIKLKELGFEKV